MNDYRRLRVYSEALDIAEGASRSGDKEFVRFRHIAIGSACEVEALTDMITQLDPTHDAGDVGLKRRVRGLIRRIRRLERQIRSRSRS